MGKQGKGIFGGFSGKVGNVVGRRQYGMDIIQSRPKRMNFVESFRPIFNLLLMIAGPNVTAGLGFAFRSSGGNGFNKIAFSNSQLFTKNGGWLWENDGTVEAKFALFDQGIQSGNYTTYQLGFRWQFGIIRVMTFGVVTDILPAGLINEKYGLLYHAGVLGFYRDFGTGKLKRVLDLPNRIPDGATFTTNLFTNATGLKNIEFGKSINA